MKKQHLILTLLINPICKGLVKKGSLYLNGAGPLK